MPLYPPAQDGYGLALGWFSAAEVVVSAALPHPALGGLVFETGGDELLSGRVLLTAAPGSGAGPALIQLWLVAQLAPALYGPAALPGNRGEILIAEAAYVAGGETELVLGEGTPANAATCAASLAVLLALSADPSWSARIALTIETDTGATLLFGSLEVGAPPALEVEEVAPPPEPELPEVDVNWTDLETRLDETHEAGPLAEPVVYIDTAGVEHTTSALDGSDLRGQFSPTSIEVDVNTGVGVLSVKPVLSLRRAALPEMPEQDPSPLAQQRFRARGVEYRIAGVERHGLDWISVQLHKVPTSGV